VECYGASPDGTELYIQRGALDLYDHIASANDDHTLETADLLGIAKEACAGLDVVHSKGYAHNDIKAENIVLVDGEFDGEPRRAVLIDFEFASHRDVDVPPEGCNAIAGTRAYFSPERVEHELLAEQGLEHDYDRQAADMWAMGITLHLAAFGAFPNCTTEPDMLEDFVAPAGTSATVASLLENLLKLSPGERWSPSRVRMHIELHSVLDAVAGLETSFHTAQERGLGKSFSSPDLCYGAYAFPSGPPNNLVAQHLLHTSSLSESPVGSPLCGGGSGLSSPTRQSLRELYQ